MRKSNQLRGLEPSVLTVVIPPAADGSIDWNGVRNGESLMAEKRDELVKAFITSDIASAIDSNNLAIQPMRRYLSSHYHQDWYGCYSYSYENRTVIFGRLHSIYGEPSELLTPDIPVHTVHVHQKYLLLNDDIIDNFFKEMQLRKQKAKDRRENALKAKQEAIKPKPKRTRKKREAVTAILTNDGYFDYTTTNEWLQTATRGTVFLE